MLESLVYGAMPNFYYHYDLPLCTTQIAELNFIPSPTPFLKVIPLFALRIFSARKKFQDGGHERQRGLFSQKWKVKCREIVAKS